MNVLREELEAPFDMIGNIGVPPRLDVVGTATSTAANDTDEGQARNRRVTIRLDRE